MPVVCFPATTDEYELDALTLQTVESPKSAVLHYFQQRLWALAGSVSETSHSGILGSQTQEMVEKVFESRVLRIERNQYLASFWYSRPWL